MRPSSIQKWAGGLSLAAAAVHGGLVPEHLQEWWGYGLFFLFAAAGQAVYGLALLTDAVNPKDAGAGWLRLWRRLLWAGVVGNLAVVALYVVTRTVGVPAGPQAGEVEAVAPIDLLTKAFEGATVVLLLVLLRRAPGERGHPEGGQAGVRKGR